MNKKIVTVTLLSIVLVLLLFSKSFPVSVWDSLFLLGMAIFMCGGVLLLLSRGVFNRFIYGFKVLLKDTSKLEKYVAESEEKTTHKSTPVIKNWAVYYLMVSGGLLLTISTFYSYYLF